MSSHFCTRVAKGLKLKVRKSWGLIPTLVDVTLEKLVEGGILVGLKCNNTGNGI